MIRKITMKSIASYNDEGVELDTGHRLNFLFGYNGSGKSTIARFLYNESLPNDRKDHEFAGCSMIGFNPAQDDIVVYDEFFKNRNFIVQDEQKGIFTLSEVNESIDTKIKQLRDIRNYYEEAEKRGQQHFIRLCSIEKSQLQKVYDYCWNTKNIFSAFVKANFGFPGIKNKNYEFVNLCLAKGGTLYNWKQLSEEYQNLYEKGIHKVDENVDKNYITTLIDIQEKLASILEKVIIGNKDIDIAKLIDELHITQWVHQGVNLLEKSPTKCPFCQQEINNNKLANLKEQFTKYFDKTFEESINEIKQLENEYYSTLKLILDRLKSIASQYNPMSLVSSLDNSLRDSWEHNRTIIEEKISKPNEKKELLRIDEYKEKIDDLYSKIEINNKQFEELDKSRKAWVRNCWIYYSNKCKKAIDQYKINLSATNKSRRFLEVEKNIRQAKISYLTQKIDSLLKKTTNTTDAKDKINKLLNAVGYTGFSIEENGSTDTGISTYHLKRGGKDSNNIYQL